MISHNKSTINEDQAMDASLKRSLHNWASRKPLPRASRRRLLTAAKALNRRRDGWRKLAFMRLLPEQLQTYFFENTWSWGSPDNGRLTQALRVEDSSYMTMFYIYSMRIAAQ